jgi:hypothetical protein
LEHESLATRGFRATIAGDPQAIEKPMDQPAARTDPRRLILVENFVDYFRNIACKSQYSALAKQH